MSALVDEIDPTVQSPDSKCMGDVKSSLTANIALINFKLDDAKNRILCDFHQSGQKFFIKIEINKSCGGMMGRF